MVVQKSECVANLFCCRVLKHRLTAQYPQAFQGIVHFTILYLLFFEVFLTCIVLFV